MRDCRGLLIVSPFVRPMEADEGCRCGPERIEYGEPMID